MDKIKVLIIDDSALMRKLIMEIIEQDEQLEVVATAMNGIFGLSKLKSLKPDIITLDIEMPQMNGLEFLKEKRNINDDTPVIVFSSLTSRGSQTTMEALELGAKDFVLKPSGSVSTDINSVKDEIIEKIKSWAKKYKANKIPRESIIDKNRESKTSISKITSKIEEIEKKIELIETNRFDLISDPKKIKFIAIGISTGGPEALRQILPAFKTCLPIIIVQHMPEGFTNDFAISLNKITNVNNYSVKEIEDNEIIKDNWIYIAPGNHQISLNTYGNGFIMRINQDPPVNNHRPSVDYFFSSLYNNIKENCFISIIMTGMGKDGAYYTKKLHDRGIFTIGQDEDSCIVFGMPKVAIQLGGIDKILSLNQIPEFINKLKNS